MLDKTVEYIGVLMENSQPDVFPDYRLAGGFSFVTWQPGLEEDWSRLQHESGQLESLAAARKLFATEFMTRPELLPRQCYFVRDDRSGELVATTSLWPGDHFGQSLQRIHWVTVRTDYQGQGLAKALMTKGMQCFNETGYGSYTYLTSQTWSYKALNLYAHFGFTPYFGPKPVNWHKKTEDFTADTKRAWQLVRQKLGDRIEPGLLQEILQAGP